MSSRSLLDGIFRNKLLLGVIAIIGVVILISFTALMATDIDKLTTQETTQATPTTASMMDANTCGAIQEFVETNKADIDAIPNGIKNLYKLIGDKKPITEVREYDQSLIASINKLHQQFHRQMNSKPGQTPETQRLIETHEKSLQNLAAAFEKLLQDSTTQAAPKAIQDTLADYQKSWENMIGKCRLRLTRDAQR